MFFWECTNEFNLQIRSPTKITGVALKSSIEVIWEVLAWKLTICRLCSNGILYYDLKNVYFSESVLIIVAISLEIPAEIIESTLFYQSIMHMYKINNAEIYYDISWDFALFSTMGVGVLAWYRGCHITYAKCRVQMGNAF